MTTTAEYADEIASDHVAVPVGFEIVTPSPQQLQLDIDSEAAWLAFEKRWTSFKPFIFDQYGREPTFAETKSKSGNRHITVTLPWQLSSPWERIALQAVLHSDLTREYLSCFRAILEDPNPTLLLERVA